ncbi:hypothetical protein OPQ81_007703 [Rhizoctonia solani]|nr:hypothetical protein OPQ81_007703 [Rhizoctonia solani]
MSNEPKVNKWDQHIHPPAFDNERRKQSGCPSSGTSGSGHSSTHSELSEKEVNFSSPSSLGSTCHVIPNLEAHLYYFGICGHRHGGPKLIFRSSKDVFTLTLGPEQYPRMMQLLPVYHHNKLAQDNLWQTIRSEVVKLLDERGIRLTSVDLARFRWEEPNADGSSKIVTTPVTIWVGVLPDTLTGDIAFESPRDILQLLQEHSIFNIDVAYRESVTRPLSGPELLAPVSDFHPPEDAIVPVTTALGMSIAGLKTPHMQGTLGFFFRVGRRQLFLLLPGPKKEVALMGNTAFADLLASIQARIGILNNTSDGSNDAQVVSGLASTEGDMRKKKAAIEELKKFYIKMKKEWSELNERVIGYVVWAPPISVLTPPHGYTKDMCVIKLNEKKFSRNFKGNVIDLGPEIEPGQFMSFMYPRHDAPSEFDYPEDRLFRLRAILSADEISDPNNQDHNGDPVRFVIKRGLTTRTTIGRLTGFESHARRYTVLGHLDSLEAAIYPYDNDSGPFSRGGDSGSLIADSLAKFGALLTGGTGTTDSSDITYVTPMYWLWNEVVKPKFPGATLYFDIPEN